MLDKQAITLQSLTARTAQERLILRVDIQNTQPRTLYAYATVRRYQYNLATRVLTLELHDRHLQDDLNAPHMPEPRFLPLEQNTVTVLELDLPAVIHRIRDAQERQGGGDLIEHWPIAQASEVRLEVAHQDTPYYYNPARGNAVQLKEWGAQIAAATFPIKPTEGGGAPEDDGYDGPPPSSPGQSPSQGQGQAKSHGKGHKTKKH
ncbi:MAG TPA: hypothetical protein VIT92_05190 [Burkholderiaceae bacterium]